MEHEHPLLNECILSQLFEFGDAKLLKTCRLVCKTWNVAAGFHLRKKTVIKLKEKKIQEFQKTFQTPSDASMKLIKKFNFCSYYVGPALQSVILEYSASIESLRLRPFGKRLAETLFALPSLEHLEIVRVSCNPPVPGWNRGGSRGNTFQKLKSCILEYDYNFSVIPAEHFLKNPQDFYLSLLQSCEKTLESLELSCFPGPAYEALMSQTNFQRLKKLVLRTTACGPQNNIHIDRWKSLLRANSAYLETFSCLLLPMDTTGPDVMDILHILVNARHIELICSHGFSSKETFQVMDLPTFPNLHRLKLRQSFGPEVDLLASRLPNIRELGIYLPKHESKGWKLMKHLEELKISSSVSYFKDVSRYHWDLTHDNFPNLTKLTITLAAGSGRTIFTDLRNLKELICEKDSTICDEDITGIESEKLLTLQNDPDHVPRTHPYIGDLKSLQVLRLEGPAITDVSLKYGVSQLESLTHLLIQYPEVRVTKIVYGEHFQDCHNNGNVDQPRIRRTVLRKVCLQRINPSSYQLDIQSLMLPKVPNLMELNVKVSSKHRDIFPVNPKQAKNIKSTRPSSFTYHRSEIDSWSILKSYPVEFSFQ